MLLKNWIEGKTTFHIHVSFEISDVAIEFPSIKSLDSFWGILHVTATKWSSSGLSVDTSASTSVLPIPNLTYENFIQLFIELLNTQFRYAS